MGKEQCFESTTPHPVRYFCPETCGGASYFSGQAMGSPNFGTPRTCVAPLYVEMLQTPCVEQNVTELVGNLGWQRYAQSVTSGLVPFFNKLHIFATGEKFKESL